jgi:hypothetical protein
MITPTGANADSRRANGEVVAVRPLVFWAPTTSPGTRGMGH